MLTAPSSLRDADVATGDHHVRPRGPIDLRAWWIVALLFLLTTVNLVDRMVLSAVGPVLQAELHFSNTQYSWILFAFMVGMTLGQLPMGMLLDRVGARFGLSATLVGWSVANMLQAAARTVVGFSGLRLAMGLFECASISGGVKAIGEILPPASRALALGIVNMGFILGSVVAPPLVVYITQRFGWHAAFLLPSLGGLLWLLPWVSSYGPQRRAEPSMASRRQEASVRELLGIRQMWGVIAMRATNGPLSQFYWFWLPLYLVHGRGVSLETMAGIASLAYLLGGSGNLAGGYLSSMLIRYRFSVDRSRKLTFGLGVGLCALCTFFVPLVTSLTAAGALVGIAFFGNNVMSCTLYAVISDVFPESTLARVTGMTGIGEGLVTMTLMLVTGVVVDRFSFAPVFFAGSTLPIASAAALLWLVRRCVPIQLANTNMPKRTG